LLPLSASKIVGPVCKSGLFNHTKKKSQEKNKKKINPRHRLISNRLPEGEEWALPIALDWNFSPNCNINKYAKLLSWS